MDGVQLVVVGAAALAGRGHEADANAYRVGDVPGVAGGGAVDRRRLWGRGVGRRRDHDVGGGDDRRARSDQRPDRSGIERRPDRADSATPATSAGGVTPQGFDAVAAEITAADGEVCAVCLWLAADPEQRGRGLMGVTDMGGADGMVFRFEGPSTSAFWMRDTPMPLSIAFFDADGVFVSATDMAPCLDGLPAACPRYRADGAYTSAIEVPAGRLPELLIGPGSRLHVLDAPCDR